MLKDLFISKTRVKLLEEFLSDPSQMFHVRDLVRRVDEEINAVRRELLHLEEAGVVKRSNEATDFIIGLERLSFVSRFIVDDSQDYRSWLCTFEKQVQVGTP